MNCFKQHSVTVTFLNYLSNKMYTRDEQIDMLLIFGECRKNSRLASELYRHRYRNRNCPPSNYFWRLETKLRREPAVQEDQFIINEDAETNVLAYVNYAPSSSLREIEHECNISRSSAWRILKKHGFKSYKYQIHQELYEDDFNRRVTYCNWFLHQYNLNNNFHNYILFSDESRFTNFGLFNRNNTRYWAKENQRVVQIGNRQIRFGFNVWLGIIAGRIFGPIIFEGALTGERYLEFLQNEMEIFFDNLPDEVNERIIFQQDGAGPHNFGIVQNHLHFRFGNRWMGTNGPIRWPARSPDLTPMDFFIWGYLKDKVYIRTYHSQEELENSVRNAIYSITQEQINRSYEETLKRVRLCLENNGQHFEQLL